MRITPSGYVGIGTSSPSDIFQVDAAHSQIRLRDTDDGKYVQFSYSSGFLAIRNNSTSANHFFLNESGNVGIGLTNPLEKLHVYGGNAYVDGNNLLFQQKNNGTNDGMGIGFQEPAILKVFSDANIYFKESDTDVAKINFDLNNGRVAIGDNVTPTEKLVVDGKILAEEVKVQNVPASDYVFEPEYNLRSLSEVDQFIKDNKHLPDIPSSKEFKENGVGLGEMDDMLLRKVEELTLYMIKQENQIKELRNEISKLKDE